MKRVATVVAALVILAALMFAEYRYIMVNRKPDYADDGYLCIEFMGQTDSYYAEPIFVEIP